MENNKKLSFVDEHTEKKIGDKVKFIYQGIRYYSYVKQKVKDCYYVHEFPFLIKDEDLYKVNDKEQYHKNSYCLYDTLG